MVHVDFHDRGASSYEEYLRTVLRLGMPYRSLEEAYRRMVFNVMAVNQDDHVKNLSFQMARDGTWSLSPAYDLTFARGADWTARHQMRVRDKIEGLRAEDLLAVGTEFDINRPKAILEQTRAALDRFEEFALAEAAPEDTIRHVRSALDLRARELGA